METRLCRKPQWRRAVAALVACALAVGAWAGIASSARADNLDVMLLEQAPKVMDYLHKQGYKNIGVLPFRVQKGKSAAEFNVGELNTNLATRMENLLVLLVDPNNPIGIINDAGHNALNHNRHATYLTAAGRKSLFDASYPLVWGQTMVKPDAFVTGDVTLAPDNKKCTVVVKVFDNKGGDLKEIDRFSVKTDRTILGDAGQSFALTRSIAKKRGDEQDDAAAQNATQKDENKDPADQQPTQGGGTAPGQGSADHPVILTILYDDQPASTEADPDSPGERRARLIKRRGPVAAPGSVAEPKEGQKVTLRLENKGPDQMAVVLKVNGLNTLFQETQDPLNCTKWVLEPGKTYDIRGFYTGETGENLLAFKVLSDEESRQKAEEMKDNTSFGCVEIFVFRSGGGADPEELQISRHVSFRGTKKELTKGQAAPRNVREAQSLYAQKFPVSHAGTKLQLDKETVKKRSVKSRGAIGTEGSAQKGGELKRTDFNNPTEVYSQKIRYYTPGAAPGGTQPGTGQGGTGQGGTGQGGTGQGQGGSGQGQGGTGQGQGSKPPQGQGQGQGSKPPQGQGNPPPGQETVLLKR